MDVTEDSFWPDFIRELRVRNGFSQTDLAEVLGVDQTAVSRWERGKDAPRAKLRRAMLDLYRASAAHRQDQVLRTRVRNSVWPTSLVGPGAVFLEINGPAIREANLPAAELRGRPIYGLFGPAVDDVTSQWETSGIFRGEIAMTISLNRLGETDNPLYMRTMDTPHFSADGAVWCVCEIQRITADAYAQGLDEFGGPTFEIPFDALRD